MTGIAALSFYSSSLFQIAGIEFSASQFATIGVGATLFVGTLISVPLMDKLGRRILFLTGSLGQIICLSVMTISLKLEGNL